MDDEACLSELEPFVRTAVTLDTHRERVANAITLNLTNAGRERMDSTVSLVGHRARASAAPTHSSRVVT